jgi:hypothetical protein
MAELVFEVVQESDGGYRAEYLIEGIFTEGDTWDELRRNVLEATSAFFFDRPRPERVRLHLAGPSRPAQRPKNDKREAASARHSGIY